MKRVMDDYFDWMCQLVSDEKYTKQLRYKKLLLRLFETDFNYILPRDGNRYEDGIDLRYRFGYENNLEGYLIASTLDDKPCSILEMMIALAIRCEEQIMNNPDIGDRTGYWFWNMVVNLGLGRMTDTNFSIDTVDDILNRFIHRQYEPDGEGGLFTVKDPKHDMRETEIWYQAMWYLNEVLEGR